jgi:hypothetical protein
MRIHSPQITGSAANTNIVLTTVTSSISVLSSSFAATSSYANNFTVGGTLTAQTINVQTITSSIEFVTGSTRNGSTTANTHQFTGSVSITGSLAVNESNVILTNQTSSMSVATASYWSGSIINATSASYALTASYASNVPETASYALQANSASFALTASYISGSGGGVGFPFSGSAIITGSLFVSGSTISGSFVGDGSGITGLTAGGKIHTQSSAASTWTVSHNLGVQYPNVTVYDNSNNVIIPQTITATDTNTLTLTFGSAVAGYAVAGIGGIISVQGRTTQQYFTASTTWSFAHNLGDKYVSLQAFDDAFEMVIPTTIRLVDATSSLMLFDSASSGYAVATIGGDLPAISSSYAGYTLQVASSAPYSASWVAVPNVTVTTAQTASYANNFTVGGTLTAQTINVQTITSSIEFVTGSTRFGSLSTNTHQFTGSVLMTGSLSVVTTGTELQVNASGVNIGNALTDNHIISGSVRINPNGLFVSSSGNVGIGTTAPAFSFEVYKTGTDSTIWGYNIAQLADSTANKTGLRVGTSTSVSGLTNLVAATDSAASQLAFWTYNGSAWGERMRITSAGNVGIGVTPSAWASPTVGKVIQIGNRASVFSYNNSTADIANNLYFNGSDYIYIETAFATMYRQGSSDGTHTWYSAASGTAGTSVPLTERMRIAANGQITTTFSLADNPLVFANTSTNPYGPWFKFTTDPNNGTNYYWVCSALVGGTEYIRAFILSNGGLKNYQANNSNLSDIRTKKDIVPLGSYWDKFKAIEIVKFKYKDQTHDDFNIGVISQQVEEVAPEFVDTDGFGTTPEDGIPLKAIYTADLYHATIKVLQEAMIKIEELSAKVTALENK